MVVLKSYKEVFGMCFVFGLGEASDDEGTRSNGGVWGVLWEGDAAYEEDFSRGSELWNGSIVSLNITWCDTMILEE